jgi:formylmethanofuran dehydrogenase subunit E
MSDEHAEELGAWVTTTQWEQVCERAKFRCRDCGEYPSVGDIDVFLDENLCGDCWAEWQRQRSD